MSTAYDALVESGFVGGLKRDVLLEAWRDLQYVGAIRFAFTEAGDEAKREATACAVTLIEQLIAKGLCSLATWSTPGEMTGRLLVKRTRAQLTAIVDESPRQPSEYFLVSTPAGTEWVTRYIELEQKL